MALAVEPYIDTGEYDGGLIDEIIKSLTVTPRMSVVDWAERYYEIPAGNAKPGPFRWTNSPWMREIAERLDLSDPCQDVVLVKPTQIAATITGTIWAGHSIHQDPSNFLYVTSTLVLAKKHMTQRVGKLLASCPEVRELVYPEGAKYGVNTVFEKEFPGGALHAVGTVSPDGLRSMATPKIHFDEVDAFEFDSGGEGDPIGLALDRSQTFQYSRKHFYTSTPLQMETSRIWPLFLSGDRRRFYVPCVRCGCMQYLKWAQVKYDGHDYMSARYECEQCHQPWTNGERIRATQAGEWQAEREWHRLMPRSYHLTGRMYSHMVEMPELVQEWLESQGKPEKLSHFSHTILGEPSSDESMYAYETDTLMQRREVYASPSPYGVQRITAGADVQDDRIEMVAIGWGYQEEAWILGHHVYYGPTELPDVWDDFAGGLSAPYPGPNDEPWKIDALSIDARYREHMVAAFCRRRSADHTNYLWPIKGARDDGGDSKQPIWPRKAEYKQKGRRRVETKLKTYFSINTFAAKEHIYRCLRYPPPGAATWHFPMELTQDFFDQFTSESLVSVRRGGKVTRKWIVKQGRRNEVLDCIVYALAALRGLYTLNVRLTIMSDVQLKGREVAHDGTDKTPGHHLTGDSGTTSADHQAPSVAGSGTMPQRPGVRAASPSPRPGGWQPRRFPIGRRR